MGKSTNDKYDIDKQTMHGITSLSSMPVMLTVKATAESFGIAQHFARQLALSGKVMAVRAGKKILINQSSVADYFNNNYLSQSQSNDINSFIIPTKL